MDKLIKDLVSQFDGLSYVDVEDSGEGNPYGLSSFFYYQITLYIVKYTFFLRYANFLYI